MEPQNTDELSRKRGGIATGKKSPVPPPPPPLLGSGAHLKGSQTSKPEPFNAIWDEEYFVQCARKKLNNPSLLVDTDSAHYKVEIDSYHTYILERWDGVDNFTPILNNNNASNELASRLMSDASKYVKVNNPFHWDIANKWNYRECFKPSATLQKKIDYYESAC